MAFKIERPQITVKEAIKFLSQYSGDTLVFCAPSIVNLDEPPETQEFILDERSICTAIDHGPSTGITFGFISEE